MNDVAGLGRRVRWLIPRRRRRVGGRRRAEKDDKVQLIVT